MAPPKRIALGYLPTMASLGRNFQYGDEHGMAGVTFNARLDDQQVRRALIALAAFGRDDGVLRAIGVGLARNTRERFDRGVDPEGQPWAPLHPLYEPLKRGPGILRESAMRGGLQGSITSDVAGRTVVVGSNKIYAAVHQFGATIRPRNAPALVFRLATGQMIKTKRGSRPETQLVFTQSVTIPARPYLGLSSRDADTVREVVFDALERAMRT
jgi:phage virion morphogenesis protein